MAVGAQVAARVEARYTPAASIQLAEQRQSLATQVAEMQRSGADPAAVAAMESELASLRREELRAIEWRPLWALPAVFAGVILLLFLTLFRDRRALAGPANGSSSPAQPALE
jgi:hypothetical protein